jgi:hypothetical protein
MALLRVLSRSAFICNICFLISLVLLLIRDPVSPGLASLIIAMGFVLSILLNVVVNISVAVVLLRKKPLREIPRFLLYANALFLVIQITLLILPK